jgi:carboxymethylenebutenolidase
MKNWTSIKVRDTHKQISAALVLVWAASVVAAPVPLQPTEPGTAPDAILGTAGPPMGEPVNYFPEDAQTTGYLAEPAGAGPHGAVVLIHDWYGLRDRIRQTADALAAEGYVALAADMYRGRTGSTTEENRALMMESLKDPSVMVRNLDAAVSYLKARGDITGKVAAMGWCYGGGVALSFALGSENHEGTAIFYGRLVDDPERLKSIHHEIYGTFGQMDSGPSPEQVHAFVAAMRAAGIDNDVHIYDDVGHGFWLYVEQDPENRLEPAIDAWTRLKSYLDRTVR